jgi:hypothetical protein
VVFLIARNDATIVLFDFDTLKQDIVPPVVQWQVLICFSYHLNHLVATLRLRLILVF